LRLRRRFAAVALDRGALRISRIGRWKDALVVGPGLANQTRTLQFGFRDESDDLAHVLSKAGGIVQPSAMQPSCLMAAGPTCAPRLPGRPRQGPLLAERNAWIDAA